jgi:RimJ/RimL family protein N-acetyltransferase
VGIGVRRTFLYRIDAPGQAAAGAPPRWEALQPNAVKTLQDIGPFDAAEGLRRLERGDECFTVSIDGRLAHYSWVQQTGSHEISDAGLFVPVKEREFWIFNCRTADWARGRGIYPAVLARIVRERLAGGSRTAWIYTSEDNLASQRGILRAGFQPAGTLRAVRVGTRYYPLKGDGQGQ